MERSQETLEEVFTSSGTKLLKHLDRLKEYQETGKLRPVNLQIAPTDKCNLDCTYCSVKHREGDEIPFEDMKKVIYDFVEMGILSAEVTGGGDPTLYPQINELIQYLTDRNITVGFITNGLALHKLTKETLNRLTWLRISLSFLDEGAWINKKARVKDIEIPTIKGTLGFSYVWNQESTIEKLEKINEYAKRYNASFVRIVPNCLNVFEQGKYKADILPIMDKFPNFFFQTKSYEVYPTCMIGWLKPYLNADGYLYHCSANPLLEQKFHRNFRICHMSEIRDVWEKPFPADVSCCEKGKCFYSEQNRMINSLVAEVPHEHFI